jgi:hypothetical protein
MQSADGEGPAWNKFWMSLENETESVMSGDASTRPPHTPDARSLMSPDVRPGALERGDSVLPNDSASHNGADSPDQHSAVTGGAAATSVENAPFPFKFKAPSGRMHRLQVLASAGIAELVLQVAQKLGAEADVLGGVPEVDSGSLGKSGFALSYLDNEGDSVSITTDLDLLDAVGLADRALRAKVDLFVHHPDQPAIPPTTEPHPTAAKEPSPVPSGMRRRGGSDADADEDEEVEHPKDGRQHIFRTAPQPQPEQLVAGVPNDLLLPGAIVTLAFVIAGVFVINRVSNR